MKKKVKTAFLIFLPVAFTLLLCWFLMSQHMIVLSPKGLIGLKQKNLIILSTLLMLIVVVPVFLLTMFISWRYRKNNREAKYNPEWDYSLLAELIWWGFPCVIIVILSVLVWKSSHELDPFRPLESDKKTIKIQVIALNWKWLFIYPEEGIALVNFCQFPENTPIDFEITSDAPMNSFWIPELGGQIFAMSGMVTHLQLMADEPGDYRGSSAQISGRGFSGMNFIARSSSEADFQQWVSSVQQSQSSLGIKEYKKLAEPSEYDPVSQYQLKNKGLFDWVVMTYMMPMDSEETGTE